MGVRLVLGPGSFGGRSPRSRPGSPEGVGRRNSGDQPGVTHRRFPDFARGSRVPEAADQNSPLTFSTAGWKEPKLGS